MGRSPEHSLRFEQDSPGEYRIMLAGEYAGFISRAAVAHTANPWAWTVCRPFLERTTSGRCRTLADARKAVAKILPETSE